MGLFSQVIHRLSTALNRTTDRGEIVDLQADFRALKEVIALLRLDQQEHAAKTSKNLESYRARSQPRKHGKFATQEPAQSSLDGGSIETPTHDQIESLARSSGIIR